MNQIQIKGTDGSYMKDCTNTSDNDEIDFMSG
jgi:hypothetical protein